MGIERKSICTRPKADKPYNTIRLLPHIAYVRIIKIAASNIQYSEFDIKYDLTFGKNQAKYNHPLELVQNLNRYIE